MKTKYNILRKTATLFACILLLASCLKEDLSNCPAFIRVYFTVPTEGDAINPDHVDRMNLYVFDSEGYYVGEFIDSKITGFNADYYIDCSGLLPGKYRFIAWGGKDERDYITNPLPFEKGKTTFDDALLILEHSGSVVSTVPHHIFYAELPVANVIAGNSIQYFYMPLVQVSNTINIHTVGLPADACDYVFNITDCNSTYRFDLSFVSNTSDSFTYTAQCTKDEAGQLHATLTVLRLSADRHTPQLDIFNTTNGKTLYPTGSQLGDLIGLILSAYPKNNFETTHTYDIVLTFKGDPSTGMSVTISINGWKVKDQNNQLID